MIVARLYHVDLTAHGSGRTGATNVLRTLGKLPAALVFAGDFLKGLAAVLVVRYFIADGNAWLEFIAAAAAVVGHSYSVFIGFKGGRGVVTGMGATMAIAPVQMIVAFGVGVLLVALTRYVSVGSVVGAMLGGALLVWLAVATNEPALAVWGVLVGGFIVIAHRDNIGRLLAGKERKLGERAL